MRNFIPAITTAPSKAHATEIGQHLFTKHCQRSLRIGHLLANQERPPSLGH